MTSKRIWGFAGVGLLVAAGLASRASSDGQDDWVSWLSARGDGAGPSSALQVMVALSAIIIASRAFGSLFSALRQPRVLGELWAGICLGPSLLGQLAPRFERALFPESALSHIGLLSQLGVIFFMFLVGLDFDARHVLRNGRAIVGIALAGIVVPFCLGMLIAVPCYGVLAPGGVALAPFALFLGASMSVTAFPVLARVLAERGLKGSRIGELALACAALDDVTAWCLLAGVVGIVRNDLRGAVVAVVASVAYVSIAWRWIRPLIVRWAARQADPEKLSPSAYSAAFVLMFSSAALTEWIGIHAIFGAFLFGILIPKESGLARGLSDRLESIVSLVLLPAFFAASGLRTRIDLLSSWRDWLLCLLLLAVACCGKFGGAYLAARVSGLARREAASMGVLMNIRGLMELVVLNVGLDLGMVSPRLFAMMVIVALVTTLAGGPILDRLYPDASVDAWNRRAEPQV